MAVECGVQRQHLRTETIDKGILMWLTDTSRWIWEHLPSRFFARQSQRVKTLDEIIPLGRCRERPVHDGFSRSNRKWPQAMELAPGRERTRGQDDMGNLTRGRTMICIAINNCLK